MATTARQNGKHPGGRPRTTTPAVYSDEQLEQIDKMAESQCKDGLIAEVLGVSDDSFRREFATRTRKKRAEGKRQLLSVQFAKAKAGDVTMLIWTGKQHLEQADKQEVEHSGSLLPVLSIKVDQPTLNGK